MASKLSKADEVVKCGIMRLAGQPGTFSYGGSIELDEGLSATLRGQTLDRESPYDFEDRRGARPTALHGSGLTPEDLDPATVYALKEEFRRLQEQLRQNPALLSDYDTRQRAKNLAEQLMFVSGFYEDFPDDMIVIADQLAFDEL